MISRGFQSQARPRQRLRAAVSIVVLLHSVNVSKFLRPRRNDTLSLAIDKASKHVGSDHKFAASEWRNHFLTHQFFGHSLIPPVG